MRTGEELLARLEVYRPGECEHFLAAVEQLNARSPETILADLQATGRRLAFRLPGFRERTRMRRIIPAKQRRRWITRQLELATKAAKRSGE